MFSPKNLHLELVLSSKNLELRTWSYIVKYSVIYLSWTTLSASLAVLPRGPVRVTPHGSSVTTRGNRSTWRKPVMFGRFKLENTLLTCDQCNLNQVTACSRNRTPVTKLRGTCTTTAVSMLCERDVLSTQK